MKDEIERASLIKPIREGRCKAAIFSINVPSQLLLWGPHLFNLTSFEGEGGGVHWLCVLLRTP